MKKIVLLFACLIIAGICRAEKVWHFQVDGIKYNISEGNTVVLREGCLKEYGVEHVEIPPYVTYNSVTYKVTAIEEAAFRWKSKLKSIVLPNTLERIEYQAFFECTALTSIDIPASVKKIGIEAFMGCTGLTSLTLPNNDGINIYNSAFAYCTGLTHVTIPPSMTKLIDVFHDCTSRDIDTNPRNL